MSITLKISDIKIKRDIEKNKKAIIPTESLRGQGRMRGTTHGKMNYQNN